MKKIFIIATSFIFIACSKESESGYAYNQRPSDQSSIIHGTPMTNTNNFKSVFILDDGCTATFVSKNVFLTAAHCVHDSETTVFGIKAKLFKHPKHDTSLFYNGLKAEYYDMAVGILEHEVSLSDVDKPINICDVTKPEDVLGKKTLFIGYGCSDIILGDFGTKRYGYSTITKVDQALLETDESNGPASCPGDSGAPYLMIDENKSVCYISTNYSSDRISRNYSTNIFDTVTKAWLNDLILQNQIQICGLNSSCEATTIPELM